MPSGDSDWAKAQYAYNSVEYEETITVETFPDGADVYLNEELVGSSPVDITLTIDELPVYWKFKAGTGHFGPLQVDNDNYQFEDHLLGVTAPGYFQARENLTLENSPALYATLGEWLPDPEPGSGQARTQFPDELSGVRTIEMTLLPQTKSLQTPTAEGIGTLLISHPDPAAEIYIDGRFVGNPPVTLSLPQGDHEVEVRFGQSTAYSRKVSVYNGSSATLNTGN
ncbi:MAG: PEGA domain-containing protein [Gammaproteobacteria bacterium]